MQDSKELPSTTSTVPGDLFDSKDKITLVSPKSSASASSEETSESTISSGSPTQQGYASSSHSDDTSNTSLMGLTPRKHSREDDPAYEDQPLIEYINLPSKFPSPATERYPRIDETDSNVTLVREHHAVREPQELAFAPNPRVGITEGNSPYSSSRKEGDSALVPEAPSQEDSPIFTLEQMRYSREPPERDENISTPMRHYSPHQVNQTDYYRNGNYSPDNLRRPSNDSTISSKTASNILGTPYRRTRRSDEYLDGYDEMGRRRGINGNFDDPYGLNSGADGQSHSAPEVQGSKNGSYNDFSSRASDDSCICRKNAAKRKNTGTHHMEHYRTRSNTPHRSRPQARDQCYENCNCCHCNKYDMRSDSYPCDDSFSCYSDSSKNSNMIDLAYQNNDEYMDLVQELEDTLSQRNKERVRRTMREFEIMSSQNKNLEKPIFDDDEPAHDGKLNKLQRRKGLQTHRKDCRCKSQEPHRREMPEVEHRCVDYAAERDNGDYYEQKRTNSGYVENVVRNMDPNPSIPDQTRKFPKFKRSQCCTRWQMDPRTGEWFKVYDEYEQRAMQSGRCMYDDRGMDRHQKHARCHDRRTCSDRYCKCKYSN